MAHRPTEEWRQVDQADEVAAAPAAEEEDEHGEDYTARQGLLLGDGDEDPPPQEEHDGHQQDRPNPTEGRAEERPLEEIQLRGVARQRVVFCLQW